MGASENPSGLGNPARVGPSSRAPKTEVVWSLGWGGGFRVPTTPSSALPSGRGGEGRGEGQSLGWGRAGPIGLQEHTLRPGSYSLIIFPSWRLRGGACDGPLMFPQESLPSRPTCLETPFDPESNPELFSERLGVLCAGPSGLTSMFSVSDGNL